MNTWRKICSHYLYGRKPSQTTFAMSKFYIESLELNFVFRFLSRYRSTYSMLATRSCPFIFLSRFLKNDWTELFIKFSGMEYIVIARTKIMFEVTTLPVHCRQCIRGVHEGLIENVDLKELKVPWSKKRGQIEIGFFNTIFQKKFLLNNILLNHI